MTTSDRAAMYAKAFPKFPPLRFDARWLDGVWVMGNDYKGSGYYGAYPPAYLRRVLSMFPEAQGGNVLHLFSGSLPAGTPGIRIDLMPRQSPDVVGRAEALPFAGGCFDLILADPPYSPDDAKRYGTPMVNRKAVLREAARVMKPGGNLVWLDTVLPMFRKVDWHLWGLIGLVRSTNHRVRLVSMFRRVE